jgi:hypothetical protein
MKVMVVDTDWLLFCRQFKQSDVTRKFDFAAGLRKNEVSNVASVSVFCGGVKRPLSVIINGKSILEEAMKVQREVQAQLYCL